MAGSATLSDFLQPPIIGDDLTRGRRGRYDFIILRHTLTRDVKTCLHWTFMKPLSIGDIARLAGYTRQGIHRLAVEGRIPFKPIKQPPEGQYRFANTRELRAWCEHKRYSKPRAEPRQIRLERRRIPTYAPRSGFARDFDERVFAAMGCRVFNRDADPADIQNAILLIDACAALVEAPLDDHDTQPCTRGTLAVLAQHLLGLPLSYNRSRNRRRETAQEMVCYHRDWLLGAMPKSEERSAAR
jgi:hypothetical protein